jgi:hypothetical protein
MIQDTGNAVTWNNLMMVISLLVLEIVLNGIDFTIKVTHERKGVLICLQGLREFGRTEIATWLGRGRGSPFLSSCGGGRRQKQFSVFG